MKPDNINREEELVSLRYLGVIKDPNGTFAVQANDSYYHFDPDGEVRAIDVPAVKAKAPFRELTKEEQSERAKMLKAKMDAAAAIDEQAKAKPYTEPKKSEKQSAKQQDKNKPNGETPKQGTDPAVKEPVVA
jgi:outer membrane translocation and assembly module TamA